MCVHQDGLRAFTKDAERFFSFWSLRLGPDGKVVQTKDTRVAELHACFGPTSEPARQNFYAEVKLSSISFRGNGECLAVKVDFPEAGLFPSAVSSCSADCRPRTSGGF